MATVDGSWSMLADRPKSADGRLMNLESLPEDFDFTGKSEFSSVGIDDDAGAGAAVKGTERPQFPREKKRRNASSRPNSAPASPDNKELLLNPAGHLEAQNANFRSARYLATQWSSRSTQWSASSSMKNFKDVSSSSKQVTPPPALREHESDSESDDGSLDESVISQVSEARKMLDSWMHRSSSVSSHKSSNNGIEKTLAKPSDHFEMADSFGFAVAAKPHVKSDAATIASKQNDSFMFSAQSSFKMMKGISTDSIHAPEKTTRMYLQSGGFTTPESPSTAPSQEESPRTVMVSPGTQPNKSQTLKKVMMNGLRQSKSHSSSKHVPAGPEQNHVKQEAKLRMLNKVHVKQRESAKHLSSTVTSSTTVPKRSTITTSNAGKVKNQKPAAVGKVRKEPRKITWDIFEFVFTFSLLTSEMKAPPIGEYVPDDDCSSYRMKLKFRTKLLHEILNKFAVTLRRIRSLSNEHGKYMMCTPDCTPSMKHVRRDGE